MYVWGGGAYRDKSSMINGWISRRITKTGSWGEERCGGGGDELTGDKSSMINGWISRRITKTGSWGEERCGGGGGTSLQGINHQ